MAKGLIFKLPPGIDIPDGTQEGETFQAMATLRLLTGRPGEVELTEIDSIPIDKSPPERPAPDRSDINQPSPSAGLSAMFSGGG